MTTMMKAKDLKADLDWTVSAEAGRYSRIAGFLTEAWLAEPKLDGVRSKVVLGGMGSQVTTWRRDVSGNFPTWLAWRSLIWTARCWTARSSPR